MMSFIRRRLLSTLRYSCCGLRDAWRSEEAFRVEVVMCCALLPLAVVLADNGCERALLLLSLGLVCIVELLNTGLEKVVDRVSTEHHALSKTIKDIGSAAVLLSIVTLIGVWLSILL
jgi:diacylglycerol kinase (ATP)